MIPFSALKLIKQYRNQPKRKSVKLIGVDTETDTTVNRIELLCDENGNYLNPLSSDDLISFFFSRRYRGSWLILFNLKFDSQAFLKWFDPAVWRDLWDFGETTFNGLKMKLIPWKYFSISYRKQRREFFDISQFFDFMSLDSAAEKFLGERKLDFDREHITDFKHPDTIKYCTHDAWLTGRLARYLYEVHQAHFGDSPFSLMSKASMSEKHFSTVCKIPTVNNLIENYPNYLKYAHTSYRGGFFSAFKRGYFKNLYVYDINSAYPFHMSKLPDISKGRFVSFKGTPPPDAYLGWYYVRIEIKDSHKGFYYSPVSIPFKSTSFYPIGAYKTCITKLETDTLYDFFNVEIIKGVAWIPDGPLEYVFSEEIGRLYQWKAIEKEPVLRSLVKIILNSIYGKTIQKVPLFNDDHYLYRTGNLYNPFYASYITAGTRMQIFNALRSFDEKDLVMVATDSIMALKPLSLNVSDKLGDWSLEKQGEGVILGSGVYSIKDDEKTITKKRGFHTTDSLSFFDIDDFYLDRDEKNILMLVKKHISLAHALVTKKPATMNLIDKDVRELNVNFDRKRFWLDTFKKPCYVLKQQIDSLPLHINQLFH